MKSDTETRSVCCSFGAWVRSRKTGTLVSLRLDCGTWACQSCRTKLMRQWTKHVAKCFKGNRSIYKRVVARGELEALLKHVRRKHGQYVRVVLPDGRYAVYANVHFNGFNHVMGAEQAASLCRVDIESITAQAKPIAASHKWAIGKDKPERKFEFLCAGRFRPEAVKLAAVSFALDAKHVYGASEFVALKGTQDWTLADCTGFISCARSIQQAKLERLARPNYPITYQNNTSDKSDIRPVAEPVEAPRGYGWSDEMEVKWRGAVLRCGP